MKPILLSTALLLTTITGFSQANRLWATYYGGVAAESFEVKSSATALDGSGNVYVAGITRSAGLATVGAFQATNGGSGDAFLVKFDAAGNRLWATYFGGTAQEDSVCSVATDASGNVYLAGMTTGSTGLASGGYQNAPAGGADVFLVKFDPSGTRLWSTYYGGTGDDILVSGGITTDVNQNVFLTGKTSSTDFPVKSVSGAYNQSTLAGGTDVFLVVFTATGTRLWATYYGGSANEIGNSIALDASSNVYITGTTSSADFPTLNPGTGTYFQAALAGASDAFILTFSSTGVRYWVTYYGGSGNDEGCSISVVTGKVLIAGGTNSTNFPTLNAGAGTYFQGTFAGGLNDAFILRFSNPGVLQWATYYGGAGDDYGFGVVADSLTGMGYLAGLTNSSSGIASGGIQNAAGGSWDGFLAGFNSGNIRQCATYYGGTGGDIAHGVTANNGGVYIVGSAYSTTGIASGGFQNTIGGSSDAYLAKFMACACPTGSLTVTTTSTPASSCAVSDGSATVNVSGGVGPYTYLWNTSPAGSTQTITGLGVGGYTVIVTDSNGCSFAQTVTVSCSTGIEEGVVSVSSVFPNPANDKIVVMFNGFVSGELTIIDFTGREVYRENINANHKEINASGLPPGYYTISIISGLKKMREKIIIVR